jgi:hypothetical protein
MSKEELLEHVLERCRKLPESQIAQLLDYAEFLAQKSENGALLKEISSLAEQSVSFDFLNEDPEIYTINDVKVKYT